MLEKYLKLYAQKFDDGFPMIPLGWGQSEREVIDMIIRCLNAGKDVYQLGYLADPEKDEDLYY